MDAFDAEIYLRLLGERLLADRDPQDHHRSPLDLPASALVVAGLIDPERAARVIDDHNTALSVRAGERGFPHFGPPTRRARGKLEPRETMILDRELAFGDGLLLLRDLTTTAGGATLRFRWRSDAASSRGHGRMAIFGGGGGAFPWGAAAPVIRDDQGNRPTVTSGGGSGNESQWDGELGLDATLSPTTAWLEVAGVRIALDRRIAPSRTWVEPIMEQGAVERFLWRRLAVAEMPFGQAVELASAIEALKAAGVLSGEEVLIGQLEAVSAQLPGRHGRPQRALPRRAAGPTPQSSGAPVPEQWRSLLSRAGHSDGPSWTRVLGALSDPFDGIQVAIHSISSDESGFGTEFEVSPNLLLPCGLDELPVAWWARDDRGNRYLGHPNGWGGHAEGASGTMQFWPALDRSAVELQIVVSADAHQAVIAVPLTSGS